MIEFISAGFIFGIIYFTCQKDKRAIQEQEKLARWQAADDAITARQAAEQARADADLLLLFARWQTEQDSDKNGSTN